MPARFGAFAPIVLLTIAVAAGGADAARGKPAPKCGDTCQDNRIARNDARSVFNSLLPGAHVAFATNAGDASSLGGMPASAYLPAADSNGYATLRPAVNGGGMEWISIMKNPMVIASENLPAGRYIVQADVQLDDSDSAPTVIECDLIGGGATMQRGTLEMATTGSSTAGGAVAEGSIALGGGVTLFSAGSVTVQCGGDQAHAGAAASITAVQVANLMITTG